MDKADANVAGGDEDLQFDQAEFTETDESEGNKTDCETCQSRIEDAYFEESGKVICGSCKEKLEKATAKGGGAVRFFRAILYGVPAAALGSGIYYDRRADNRGMKKWGMEKWRNGMPCIRFKGRPLADHFAKKCSEN